MNKTRIVAYLCVVVAMAHCTSLSAQVRMRDLFAAMPDSIIPYLTKNNRLDCIDFVESNVKMEVENLFEAKSMMEELTGDYLKMRLNETTDMQLKLLSAQGCDTLICMIKTMKVPEDESHIQLFDLKWNKIDSLNVWNEPLTDEGEGRLVSMWFGKNDDGMWVKVTRLFTNDKDLANPKEENPVRYVWNGSNFKKG